MGDWQRNIYDSSIYGKRLAETKGIYAKLGFVWFFTTCQCVDLQQCDKLGPNICLDILNIHDLDINCRWLWHSENKINKLLTNQNSQKKIPEYSYGNN